MNPTWKECAFSFASTRITDGIFCCCCFLRLPNEFAAFFFLYLNHFICCYVWYAKSKKKKKIVRDFNIILDFETFSLCILLRKLKLASMCVGGRARFCLTANQIQTDECAWNTKTNTFFFFFSFRSNDMIMLWHSNCDILFIHKLLSVYRFGW